MEKLCTWKKLDGVDSSGNMYLGTDRCLSSEKDIWFELGKSMRKKHRSVLQYHVRKIHNDIVKTFRVGILQYSKRVREMNDPEN